MRKWLYPGLHIKRWLLLLLLGIVIIALGIAYLLREVYESYSFPNWVWYATLQFIPRYIRGALFLLLGVGSIVLAFWRFNATLVSAIMPPGRDEKLVDIIYQHRYLTRGPKVVAVGGGTGLSTLLRGLKEHTSNLTAIVTVADDGGSSGRLRRELGVLPPGDFRNCLVALADAEPVMAKLFQYRFSEGSGLDGHSFGNLFIVAMSGVTGNFEQAIRESSRVLAVRGQILPSTLANVVLFARTDDEAMVRGESNIPRSGRRIRQVYLEPPDAAAHPEAVRALLAADLIVLGPGSVYTSILPNLLVPAIARAIRASSALKVYVCNVATQKGETDGYSVTDHVAALSYHIPSGLFDFVLINSNTAAALPADWEVELVGDGAALEGVTPIHADMIDEEFPLRHDPKKLGAALLHLYDERGQGRAGNGLNDRSAAVTGPR